MKLTIYFKKYFLSDLVIMIVFAGLIYLPGKLFAEVVTVPKVVGPTAPQTLIDQATQARP